MALCRALATYFNKSSQAKAELSAVCEAMDKQANVAVVQDVVTRWWSTYMMLSRLLLLQAPLQALAVMGKVCMCVQCISI